jgi:hypothetical protein
MILFSYFLGMKMADFTLSEDMPEGFGMSEIYIRLIRICQKYWYIYIYIYIYIWKPDTRMQKVFLHHNLNYGQCKRREQNLRKSDVSPCIRRRTRAS